jgi:hypothetical protein
MPFILKVKAGKVLRYLNKYGFSNTYNTINIHHKTLNDRLNLGSLYLDVFFLSLSLIKESTEINLLSLEDIKILINKTRDKVKHPRAKDILAKFKDDETKNLVFDTLNNLANHLKGDRQVIREHLKGNRSGYYHNKCKFTYQ